jgi:hypothetical protein
VVVEAVKADRFAETRIVVIVHRAAAEPDAVFADRRVATWPAAPGLAVRSERSGVYVPEARRGEGDEHGRVLDHGLGDAFAASEPGSEQLVGVAAVALGAGRTDGLATVAAGLSEDPVRFGGRRPDAPATVPVARLDPPDQPDRPRAIPGGAKLRLKAREVRPPGARSQPAEQLGRQGR